MTDREKIDLMKRALKGDAEATKILGPMFEHQTEENGEMIPGLAQAKKELEDEEKKDRPTDWEKVKELKAEFERLEVVSVETADAAGKAQVIAVEAAKAVREAEREVLREIFPGNKDI